MKNWNLWLSWLAHLILAPMSWQYLLIMRDIVELVHYTLVSSEFLNFSMSIPLFCPLFGLFLEHRISLSKGTIERPPFACLLNSRSGFSNIPQLKLADLCLITTSLTRMLMSSPILSRTPIIAVCPSSFHLFY